MYNDKELDAIHQKRLHELIRNSIEVIPTETKSIIHIDSAEQLNELVHKHTEKLIIIDFWAEWCGPCQQFMPIFQELQKEYQNKKVIFAKVNVDEVPEIAEQFQINAVPAFLFIKKQQIVHMEIGYKQKAAFARIIDSLL